MNERLKKKRKNKTSRRRKQKWATQRRKKRLINIVNIEVPFNYTQDLVTLDLHTNQLKGSIPLLYADYLDYSSNHFTSIPTNISASFLSISSNDLHGLIPASICNVSQLVLLDLSNNSLSGMIPQCLSAMSNLQVLNLRRNNITGSISDFEFPENCKLEFLELNQNQIDGQFPKSLAKCSKLQVVNLENNQITDTFPCLLRKISTLHVLALRSNKFYGRIRCPDETYGTWPMLQIIDVAHNNLHGEILGRYLESWLAMINNKDDAKRTRFYRETITVTGKGLEVERIKILDDGTPTRVISSSTGYQETIKVTNKGLEVELAKILTIFTTIDFLCNNFSGPIPKEMGELKSLYSLNLLSNAFTGAISSSLATWDNSSP